VRVARGGELTGRPSTAVRIATRVRAFALRALEQLQGLASGRAGIRRHGAVDRAGSLGPGLRVAVDHALEDGDTLGVFEAGVVTRGAPRGEASLAGGREEPRGVHERRAGVLRARIAESLRPRVAAAVS